MRTSFDIIVIGGGASGMMAAAAASSAGSSVLILERNEKLGKKLYITGKGRCNLTNSININDYYDHIARNGKFLRSAFYMFDNADLISFMEENGLETKTERGNRVFPRSDKSSDVIKALARALEKNNVCVVLNSRVLDIRKDGAEFSAITDKTVYRAPKIIIATGGLSYPSTGSTGDGYALAEKLGHSKTSLRPSLVPLLSDDLLCRELKGVSLRNVGLSVYQNGREITSETGEMLFTDRGISGPMVLTASCYMEDPETAATYCIIDLKPALDDRVLDSRMLRDFDLFKNKSIRNGLAKLLINSLIEPVLTRSGVNPDKKVNEITREERRSILYTIKHFRFDIRAFGEFSEAVITRGGIDVKEIDPKKMESRIVPGLYFAGEIIDTDAETGGYNLQIAFSTGFAAGKSAAGAV